MPFISVDASYTNFAFLTLLPFLACLTGCANLTFGTDCTISAINTNFTFLAFSAVDTNYAISTISTNLALLTFVTGKACYKVSANSCVVTNVKFIAVGSVSAHHRLALFQVC